jgi:hypothetical protein
MNEFFVAVIQFRLPAQIAYFVVPTVISSAVVLLHWSCNSAKAKIDG